MKMLLHGVLALGAVLAGSGARAADVDFNRDIRPIFASHCASCHGGVKAAGGISFVYREKVLGKAKSGLTPVVPGNPDGSELFKRITSDDPEKLMPKPGKDRARLSASEVASIKAWIAGGAKWGEHWAFVPPVEPAQPVVHRAGWARSKADALVLAHMESAGLEPSAPATRAQWLRRVTLDLTGLVPSIEDYEAFKLEDTQEPVAARQHVVDRLLASPAFGERWASMWLDLARYADTYGFEKDPNRIIWPWRDWVIRAFNSDMPFDQFTIKQLAGDLLEKPSADDLLATAFHRNTQNNTEGGTNDEEWRTAAVIDRVNTTWTVWQGMTFGCTQCHAHPYAPFPQKDFYRFSAFFDNSEDADLDDDFPRMLVPTNPAKSDEAAALSLEEKKLRAQLNEDGVKLAAELGDWKPLIPSAVKTTSGTLEIEHDGKMKASGTLNFGMTYTVRIPATPNLCAFRLTIYPDSSDPHKWPERGAVVSHMDAALISADGKRAAVKLKEVFADYLAGPFDPQNMIGAGGGFGGYPSLSGTRWCIVALQEPLGNDRALDGAFLELTMKQSAIANGGAQACPLRSFDLAGSVDHRWAELVDGVDHERQWATIRNIRAQIAAIPGNKVPVVEERSNAGRRDTRLFVRGNRLNKDESVEPGVPAVLHPPQKPERLTRLDLAKWLVSDYNPLTARVLANRLWAEMYGRGIVETLEDFGSSGQLPSNPELLDHLAIRLSHDDRWSIKTFLREIALSAAYEQSSRASDVLALRDPTNALLARGPRARLTAEMVRDQALELSGMLSAKQFGPPVYPPQPDGVWRSVYNGATWKEAKGEDRYRRAIYTFCKRTSGYPAFLTFDAPTRDACTPRRVATNTPLQALVTLNDPAFIELAQAYAKRMTQSGNDPREQIEHGFKLITLDDPPGAMVDSLLHLYDEALKEYQSDGKLSDKLGKTPESAALVLVANTLMNLDMALTR